MAELNYDPKFFSFLSLFRRYEAPPNESEGEEGSQRGNSEDENDISTMGGEARVLLTLFCIALYSFAIYVTYLLIK